jgi:hypothetical protein
MRFRPFGYGKSQDDANDETYFLVKKHKIRTNFGVDSEKYRNFAA